MTYIQVKNSFKRYQVGETEIIANHDVNFDIEKGEFVIILGASGAGKSTVLNILEEWIQMMREKYGLMVSIFQTLMKRN